MPQPQTSIWGTILTCVEIGLNIYALQAERDQGIVLDADYAKKALSENAFQLGKERDGHVYFDDVKSIVPTYELAKQGAITHPELHAVAENPEQLVTEGHYFAPEYFGDFPPPHDDHGQAYPQQQTWDNGVFLVERPQGMQLAVHQTIAEHVLSDMALMHAAGHESYWFYPLNDCAIPIYELSASHPGVLAKVINEDSLLHTLCDDYPSYVGIHNLHTEEWGHIFDRPAPSSLFLQAQLDEAAGRNNEDIPLSPSSYSAQSQEFQTMQTHEPTDAFYEPSDGMEW
ncbi:hypothetical protein [Paenibacillus graminis]|uniref:Uncharacterized protein n=1 Tax=Paenibacillus graminis TaxID=189425 RepID=A0A089MD07_9BACL|nr:hypothetical protein [Paenibacillus graminis]AIQ70250.1 hypothetical protein PGRAT_23305 [Paenibacillus graminis]